MPRAKSTVPQVPDSSPHGLILSGLQSSGGKTAVSCMLMAAFQSRGIEVQPFKVGPDFIDPGYHAFYSGSASYNLDAWMMGEEGILQEISTRGAGKTGIVEGVMGLFDGSDVRTDEGSTLELARLLNWPVVLVIPSAKAGRSLAAALRGFIAEAGEGRIAGVILNQVGGSSHADYLREAIEPLNLPVFGAIPKCLELSWPERHLGLQASRERELGSADELSDLAQNYLDLDQLLALVTPAPQVKLPKLPKPVRQMGLALDEAFHFYYEANLDYLKQQGIDLVEFSPIHDSALPTDLDGVIFGGGFPEVFAERLSQNSSMRDSVRSAIEGGLPCYAECGGLMYLTKELITREGKRYPMVNTIPSAIEMSAGLRNFGYCSCSGFADAPDQEFRGHEFHYSHWHGEERHANLWTARRKRLGNSRKEGYSRGNLHASYVHLYFPSSAPVIQSLLKVKS